jgi:phosphoglycolate phosphatase
MQTGGRFDLVIFDCDGVLVDSEPIVNRVFVEMVAELGYALDYDRTLREFSGGSTALRMRTMEERYHWSPPSDFVEQYHLRIEYALGRDLRPVAGVRAVLDQLKHARCVASNGTPDDIRTRLGHAGLLSAFEPHLFSAVQVPRGKPAPDLFLCAAASMAVVPERCAVIEDSVPGVQAGVAAGMTVFGYSRITPVAALEQAGATGFLAMQDLPALLLT